MTSKRRQIFVLLSLAGLVAASVGLALADSSRRPAAPPKPVPAGVVDCKDLDARLRTCAAHIAAVVDPEVPDRLARLAPPLRSAVLNAMADELQARTGGACAQSRGRIDEGPAVAACLGKAAAAEKASCPTTGPEAKPEACATWRRGLACEALAACLKAGFAALPATPPRPAPPR